MHRSRAFRLALPVAVACALAARDAYGQAREPDEPHPASSSFDEDEYGAVAEVEAPPREPTKRTLRGDELREVPGTRSDPLRAIEVMPSVGRTGVQDAAPRLRGAAGSESVVFLEGSPIPQLFHFGGLTSVIAPSLVERVDVYPGNFSVRYGRAVGGIVEATLREPRRDAFHALADVSVVDSSLLLEAPLGDVGGFVVAGRRSNIDLYFEHAVPKDAYGVVAAPVYYDYQALAGYRLGRHRVTVLGLGSSDAIELQLSGADDQDPGLRGDVRGAATFHRVQLAVDSRLSDTLTQRTQLALGFDGLEQRLGGMAVDLRRYQVDGRSEWSAVASRYATVTAGLDFVAERTVTDYDGPRPPQQEGDPSWNNEGIGNRASVRSPNARTVAVSPAAYLDVALRPTPRWNLVPGLRVDRFGQLDAWSVDPRLAVRFAATDAVTLKAGAGSFSQATPFYWEALPDVGNPRLGPQRALQFSAGAEYAHGKTLEVGVEGFYKHLFDRVVATRGNVAPFFENDGTGRIYGADLAATVRPTPRTVATLAYTLTRSERSDHGGPMRPFDEDQTHILAIAASHGFANGWSVGGRFRLVSGNPTTPVTGSFFDARTGLYRPVYGAVNSDRAPLFHQLDLRVEKLWKFSRWSLAAYLDLQNAYNAQNEEGRRYSYDFSKSEPILGLPILPDLGLRGEL